MRWLYVGCALAARWLRGARQCSGWVVRGVTGGPRHAVRDPFAFTGVHVSRFESDRPHLTVQTDCDENVRPS